MVGNIPPILRTWLAAIVVASVATSNSIVEPIRVVFVPSKVMEEPWRLITLFCYFGPMSFSLIQNVLLIAHSTSALESAYIYDSAMIPDLWHQGFGPEQERNLKIAVEKYKMADFAYFAAQVAASIVVASTAIYTLLGFSGTNLIFLGPIFERCLLYIWCRTTPEGQLVVLGFPVKSKHAVYVTQALYGLLSEDFRLVAADFRLSFSEGLHTLVTCEFVVGLVVVFCVGHFWWFLRFFVAGEMYNEGKTEMRRKAAAAYANVSTETNWIGHAASVLITPPWYWLLCMKLRRQQTGAHGGAHGGAPAAAAIATGGFRAVGGAHAAQLGNNTNEETQNRPNEIHGTNEPNDTNDANESHETNILESPDVHIVDVRPTPTDHAEE